MWTKKIIPLISPMIPKLELSVWTLLYEHFSSSASKSKL